MTAASRSTSRSAVSRRFKAATTKALDELMARDLAELRVAAMMIDGVFFAEQCCVVALAICADGTKVRVGLWLGDTENKTIVTNLLVDLSARGLDASGILFVLDGSKALAAGVRKVFDDHALVVCEEGDDAALEALRGDREDSPDQPGVLGMAERGEPEQRVDRRQAGVAFPGPHAVAPVTLEMVQERTDERCVEIFEPERGGGLAGLLLDEAEQETECS